MRACPTEEDEFCVLANYKSIRNREIVRVQMKGHSSKTLVDTARVSASLPTTHRQDSSSDSNQCSATEESIALVMDNNAIETTSTELTDPIAESAELWASLGLQYHTPALAASLAQMLSLATASTDHIIMEATEQLMSSGASTVKMDDSSIDSESNASNFVAYLDDAHNPGHVDAIVLVQSSCDSISADGIQKFPVHSFILRSRCPLLAQRLAYHQQKLAETPKAERGSSTKQLLIVDISDLVHPSCVHVVPLLIRFLYEDGSVDAEVNHVCLQASETSFAGLCINMVRESCLKRLLAQPSSSFRPQSGDLSGAEQNSEWLAASVDETLWRSEGVATELVKTLEMVCL